MSNPYRTTSQKKPEFSVRIVVCDHYLTKPVPGIDVVYSEFRGSDIKQVPVLRIFGSAPDGHKACLHVHGVFPYFYLPCPSSNPELQFLYQMAASLDKALNIALKQANSGTQHVYKISLVKGLPFYGYHDKDHLYLKVFLYSPGLIKQAVDLCSNGAILGQVFQPHESHLNFTLQFFIDFNLFGMSNIDMQFVSFRRKTSNSQSSTDILDSGEICSLKPESMCYYEADCAASHIINRQRVGKGDGIENPGLQEVWDQEIQRRKQLNVSIGSKSLSQGRLEADETDSHYKYEQMFRLKISNLVDKPVDTSQDMKSPCSDSHYPAESLEGSQLFDAVDVSVHLPNNTLGVTFNETLKAEMDDTLTEDLDCTVVDENIALNSSLSLHYSQVLLDSEDLDLLDILKDMDEKPIEDDSVMGTPADVDKSGDPISDDDAEYSQIFDEDTILIDPHQNKHVEDISSTWNDSFWDEANITQLDGTCDDDHVKKVRKRRMRPLKLGLSRPRKRNTLLNKTEPKSELDLSVSDEINASRETIDNISSLHLNKVIKDEAESVLETEQNEQVSNASITELVNKASIKYEIAKCIPSESYDLRNKYEPVAGPSRQNIVRTKISTNCDIKSDTLEETSESSPESNHLGFISFYDVSKIFDTSIDSKIQQATKAENEFVLKDSDIKSRQYISDDNNDEEDMKLHYSETPQLTQTKPEPCLSTFDGTIWTPKIRPPTSAYISSTLEKYNLPTVQNIQPYYSNYKDVGEKVEIGQMVIKLQSKLAQDQKPFEKVLDTISIEEWRQLLFLQNHEFSTDNSKLEKLKTVLAGNKQCILEPIRKPPTAKEVMKWLDNRAFQENARKLAGDKNSTLIRDDISKNIDELYNSQAIGLNEINNSISLKSDDKYTYSSNMNGSLQETMQSDGSFLCFGSRQQQTEVAESPVTPLVELNYLTIMVLECHTKIRGDLNPDPLVDLIEAVFITVKNDCPAEHFLKRNTTEIIVVDNTKGLKMFDRCVFNSDITYVNSEIELIEKVVESIRKHDPDIMCGYEIEMNSWGYLLERAQVLGLEIVMVISRITEKYRQKRWRSETNDFEGRVIGRVLFNVWRLFRHELALSSYSFESCMYEILKERVPKFSYSQLAAWWGEESRALRWLPVEYYLTRLSGTVRMLEKLDIINRTAELARLFGLQWWEVLSRGSQFRVESLMLRAARPLNLVALSPTVKQRAAMKAPECLPLIFEPESRFYTDPVIVLDFQSLYPSVMIAYNYCFSTCIGRVQNITGESAYEFGAWRLRIPASKLQALAGAGAGHGAVHWSPVGAGFVKPEVRRGVLPALLRRILAARQAVKKGMALQTDDAIKKAMHSRQLGLKLIANVTYGYTAANFSGRMPCVEVGDSVVAKGRETLERAIRLVQANKEWNVKVVYGDTDSLFVLVPGGSRARAWQVGREIADAVTADNPAPVRLKLEKVYQPCILQTKKRYVGFMYETPDQQEPVYEAKGIETVRRDGCPAQVKILQRSLHTLFSTGDMSLVKRDVVALLSRLAGGSLAPPELFFTREYHGPTGYRPGAAAPPNEIARRLMSRDRRSAPRTGARVSWLVCAGAPATPLVRLARTPAELARDPGLRAYAAYYATRVILPPLHRCLSLLGVDVFKWWRSLGHSRAHVCTGGGGIARYLGSLRCAACDARCAGSLCGACAGQPARVAAVLAARRSASETRAVLAEKTCASCCGSPAPAAACVNHECSAWWRRREAQAAVREVQGLIGQLPAQSVHW